MKNMLIERLRGRKPLKNNAILNGRDKYKIKELINCGGNALIYRAETIENGREVVIKEIYPAIPRLVRDNGNIRSISGIDENFRNCIERAKKEQDIINLLTGRDGKYNNYIDLEIEKFEENETFYSVGRYGDYRLLPYKANLTEALNITARILEALEPIHKAGLLHLDISPGNILQTNIKVEDKTVLKLIDFGSSHHLSDIRNNSGLSNFTRSGNFTAPELRRKNIDINIEDIGFAADLYSIGKIFCHLTGIDRTPLNKRIIERNDECSEGINKAGIRLANEIIIKSLQSDPTDRYQSVCEMKSIVYEAIGKVKKIKAAFSKVQEYTEQQFNDWKKRNDKLYGLLYENDANIPMKLKDGGNEYYINDFLTQLEKKDCRHAILTGDGGMGKTTTCMMISDMYKNQKKQVIYISLRNYRSKDDNIPNNLKKTIMKVFGVETDDDYEYLINEEDIIFLLDGINEITKYENKYAFFRELEELINKEYIQILITSRGQNEVNNYAISEFTKLTFESVPNKFIDQWLEKHKLKIADEPLTPELYSVLGNPMLLRMYAINTMEGKRYVNIKDTDFIDNPITAGEIIWNFLEYQVLESKDLYEATEENKGLGKIIFRYLLPYVAYQAEKKEKEDNNFTLSELDEYIDDFINYFIEEQAYKKFDELIKYKKTLIALRDNEDRTALLLNLCEEKFSVINEIEKCTYEFVHQHFRDIFAAAHIKNQMEINGTDVFTERVLPFHINRMLLQILLEHKQVKPFESSKIRKYLKNFRGDFGEKAQTGVFNCIQAIDYIRNGDISCENFSELDLRMCTFYGKNCGNTDFSGSYMSENVLFSQLHNDCVVNISFSPDGNYIVSASEDRTIKLWESATGKLIRTHHAGYASFPIASFSRDGNFIISETVDRIVLDEEDSDVAGETRVWSINTGEYVSNQVEAAEPIKFTPDGEYEVFSYGYSINIRESKTKTLVRSIGANKEFVLMVSYSPDGRYILSGLTDGTLKIWDSETGKLIRILEDYPVFFNGNYSFSISQNKMAKILKGEYRRYKSKPNVTNINPFLDSVDFNMGCSPDGKYFIMNVYPVIGDVNIGIYERESGKWLQSIKNASHRLWDRKLGGNSNDGVVYCFSPDSKYIAYASEAEYPSRISTVYNIAVWSIAEKRVVKKLCSHYEHIRSLSYSPDGKFIISASEYGAINIWDISSRGLYHQLQRVSGKDIGDFDITKESKDYHAFYNHDGSRIIANEENGNIKIWDAQTYREILIIYPIFRTIYLNADLTGLICDDLTEQDIINLRQNGAII